MLGAETDYREQIKEYLDANGDLSGNVGALVGESLAVVLDPEEDDSFKVLVIAC